MSPSSQISSTDIRLFEAMTNPYETNIDKLQGSRNENGMPEDEECRSNSSRCSKEGSLGNIDEIPDQDDFLQQMLGASRRPERESPSHTHSSRASFSSDADGGGEVVDDDRKAEAPICNADNLRLQKQNVLMDLERLKQKGIQLSKNYTMADDIEDMRFEMKRHLLHAEECSSVAFMKDALGLACNGLEMLNSKVGPILALDGWAAEVNESIDKYDPAMEKLYRKYWKKPIGMGSPEMEIAIGIFGSMGMHHFKTKMGMKQKLPGFGFPNGAHRHQNQHQQRQQRPQQQQRRFEELDSDEEGPP